MLKSANTAATNSHCVEANQTSLPIQPEIENKTEITAPKTNILDINSLFFFKDFTLLTPFT